MATFRGGPRDGQHVEPEHERADEIRVTLSDYSDDLEIVSTEDHRYVPDAFGNFSYVGVVK